MNLIHGNIVYSTDKDRMEVFEDAYIGIEGCTVQGIWDDVPEDLKGAKITDYGDAVIIPAFSDIHVHAPQYLNRGLEMDLLLADWLNQCTFPMEAKFKDKEFAKTVYDAFIEDMLDNGSMHACVYGTIHNEATSYLIERMESIGIKSYVGKVNMDRNGSEDLTEDTDESLKATEEFLDKYSGNKHARPILTPRFAPTCTQELLTGLGKLAARYEVGTQTHIVESKWEARQAKVLYPECSCDMDIYEQAGLLDNGPVIAAHFIFPEAEDIRILKKHNGFAAHCPDSTTSIIAGIMQTGSLLEMGVNIGPASDISAGHNIGVHTQIARAVQLSKLKEFYEPDDNRSITFTEAFWMATKCSGSMFGKTGSFDRGYAFDALVIDDMSDKARKLTPLQSVERFCYIGTKENIKARYIDGEKIDPAAKR